MSAAGTDLSLATRVDRVLSDWSDPRWLQFSGWHLHQIREYLLRELGGEVVER